MTGQSMPGAEGYRSPADGTDRPRCAPPPPPQGLASYRGRWGAARPGALRALPLPPARMPLWRGTRPLKRWRYVGVFGDELMLCVGAARVGPAHQVFWAVWDRVGRRLLERTRLRPGAVRLEPGRVLVRDATADGTAVEVELALDERDGVETVCPNGRAYAWTRKQGGVPARGTVRIADAEHALAAPAVVDDSAGYHARRTAWRWSAGVGAGDDGRPVAWNLVAGVNDPARASERTVWLDGTPHEAAPATFADDLSAVTTADGGALRFAAEATRVRDERLLLVRSAYRQPFGTFAGVLPGGIPLAHGSGVMEHHVALW